MDNQHFIELMEYIEKNTNIVKYQIQNWCAWGIIRVYLGFGSSNFYKKKGQKEKIFHIIKNPKIILNYIKSFIQYFLIIYGKKKKYDLIVRIFSNGRRDEVENKYKCVFSDDLIDSMPKLKTFVIEDLRAYGQHFSPTLNKVDFFAEALRIYPFFKKLKIDRKEIKEAKTAIMNDLINLQKKGKKKKEIENIIQMIEKTFDSRIINFLKTKEIYSLFIKFFAY